MLAQLVLDTGANCSVVNRKLLVLLGYDPAAVPGRVQITTGSAVEFVPEILVEKLQALDLERVNFPVLCHTVPPTAGIDGVLGLNLFRGLRLVVDLREGFVAVE